MPALPHDNVPCVGCGVIDVQHIPGRVLLEFWNRDAENPKYFGVVGFCSRVCEIYHRETYPDFADESVWFIVRI